jgi:DNA-binding SARP family transcriptional activator
MHARRWLDLGEAEKGAAAAKSALEIEPLHEACAGLLMRAELNMGNRIGALRVFENLKKSLCTELGVSPSEHLVQLAVAIRGDNSPNDHPS